MTSRPEDVLDPSNDDMLAFLERLERENPAVAAVALDREVDEILGRLPAPNPVARAARASAKSADTSSKVLDRSAFDWYQRLASHLPPVMTADRSVAAAMDIEIGVLAQERLDTVDRSLMSRTDIRDLRGLAARGEHEYELLVLSNLRLVFHWSRWVASVVGVDWLQDAFQAGVFGLIRGIQGWDYGLGYALSTYVSWHIRQQIQRWRWNEVSLIRLPVHVWEKLESSSSDLTDAFRQAALQTQNVLPLDEIEEDDPAVIWDGGLESVTERQDLEHVVSELLDSLTQREADILRLRHGLGDANGEPMTLDAIGRVFGVTRERIRQIETKATKKLNERPLQNLIGDLIQ